MGAHRKCGPSVGEFPPLVGDSGDVTRQMNVTGCPVLLAR